MTAVITAIVAIANTAAGKSFSPLVIGCWSDGASNDELIGAMGAVLIDCWSNGSCGCVGCLTPHLVTFWISESSVVHHRVCSSHDGHKTSFHNSIL